MNNLETVITEINAPITACIIWLHGLGADGHDFANIVPQLQLPKTLGVRFVFPHAPVRKITVNNGYPMRAWYDIYGFSDLSQEDEAGIKSSQKALEDLITQQNKTGIPHSRIVLAGFSQGGALALYTGIHYPHRLAGIMGLSTYLPLVKSLKPVIPENPAPIFLAHGIYDDILPLTLGEKTRDYLRRADYPLQWHQYPIAHQVSTQEISDISQWLSSVLRTG